MRIEKENLSVEALSIASPVVYDQRVEHADHVAAVGPPPTIMPPRLRSWRDELDLDDILEDVMRDLADAESDLFVATEAVRRPPWRPRRPWEDEVVWPQGGEGKGPGGDIEDDPVFGNPVLERMERRELRRAIDRLQKVRDKLWERLRWARNWRNRPPLWWSSGNEDPAVFHKPGGGKGAYTLKSLRARALLCSTLIFKWTQQLLNLDKPISPGDGARAEKEAKEIDEETASWQGAPFHHAPGQ